MKRAHQLQPLSRKHHLGLHIGRHAKECADTPQQITEHWQALSSYISDMSTHFQIENNLIATGLRPYQDTVPKVAKALVTLKEHHLLLHKFISETQSSPNQAITVIQVQELGSHLYTYVRFEERELLPLVETYLSKEELDSIYEASPASIKRLDETR